MISHEIHEIFESAAGMKISEAVGDNKVDNIIGELTRSTEVEIGMFVASLLNSSVNSFKQQYNTPQFEGFKKAMNASIERYRMMDESDRTDLFQKIEIMFKDIFFKNYAHIGHEEAEIVAMRYAKQMQSLLKEQNKNPQQPIDDLYPHQRNIAPKADPSDGDVFDKLDAMDMLWDNPY
jgi:hypothetical protein